MIDDEAIGVVATDCAASTGSSAKLLILRVCNSVASSATLCGQLLWRHLAFSTFFGSRTEFAPASRMLTEFRQWENLATVHAAANTGFIECHAYLQMSRFVAEKLGAGAGVN